MHLTSVTVASVLAVALLPAVMLADAKEDYRHNPIVREGAIALFQSARYGSYLAVYLDSGCLQISRKSRAGPTRRFLLRG